MIEWKPICLVSGGIGGGWCMYGSKTTEDNQQNKFILLVFICGWTKTTILTRLNNMRFGGVWQCECVCGSICRRRRHSLDVCHQTEQWNNIADWIYLAVVLMFGVISHRMFLFVCVCVSVLFHEPWCGWTLKNITWNAYALERILDMKRVCWPFMCVSFMQDM